jgi:hypothetical protein
MVPSFYFSFFVMAFLCVSQQGEFKNTPKKIGGSPCQKLLAKKVHLRKKTFSLSSFPSICFIAFLAVSLHDEPKNAIKIFLKPDQKISKNLKKNLF